VPGNWRGGRERTRRLGGGAGRWSELGPMSGFGFNGLILSCLMGLFERGGASKGSPRRVDGISQKGRWDLPEGSMGPPTRVDGTSQKGQWDLPEGSMGPPTRVDGMSQKGQWDLPEGSMGSPRRVNGISQKGQWDLPEGSMGPPRRVDGISQKGRWDLPPMSMGAAGGAHLSLVKKRCLIGIDAIVHSSVQRGVGKLSTPPCHETDPNQP